jgi:hypothetical protein
MRGTDPAPSSARTEAAASDQFVFQAAEAWPFQIDEDQIAADQVFAFGKLLQGRIDVGDSATVRCEEKAVTVRVEQIVISSASGEERVQSLMAPADAALRLKGIDPAAEWADDRVVGSKSQR